MHRLPGVRFTRPRLFSFGLNSERAFIPSPSISTIVRASPRICHRIAPTALDFYNGSLKSFKSRFSVHSVLKFRGYCGVIAPPKSMRHQARRRRRRNVARRLAGSFAFIFHRDLLHRVFEIGQSLEYRLEEFYKSGRSPRTVGIEPANSLPS